MNRYEKLLILVIGRILPHLPKKIREQVEADLYWILA
jgi:hypothetical protein